MKMQLITRRLVMKRQRTGQLLDVCEAWINGDTGVSD